MSVFQKIWSGQNLTDSQWREDITVQTPLPITRIRIDDDEMVGIFDDGYVQSQSRLRDLSRCAGLLLWDLSRGAELSLRCWGDLDVPLAAEGEASPFLSLDLERDLFADLDRERLGDCERLRDRDPDLLLFLLADLERLLLADLERLLLAERERLLLAEPDLERDLLAEGDLDLLLDLLLDLDLERDLDLLLPLESVTQLYW
mgnify:CR=1 FL=1